MIRTNDGKRILLDVEKLRCENPIYSAAYFVSQLFALFLLVPTIYFVGTNYGATYGWLAFYVGVSVSMCLSIVLWLLTYQLKNPYGVKLLPYFAFSPRLFFLSALMCFANVNPSSYWYTAPIFMLWFIIEYLAYTRAKRIDDTSIIKTYKPSFRYANSDLDIYYDSMKRKSNTWASPHQSVGSFAYKFENYGAYIGCVLGPLLFMRSQLYRDNFEPRFMILVIISLMLSLGTRYVLTDYYIFRRAMKLKQAGAY